MAMKVLNRLLNHRSFIALSGLLVAAYAASVVLYAWSIPEIGLSATIDLRVNRIDESFVQVADQKVGRLTDGWTVSHVGGEAIHSWPQWIRVIRALPERDYPPGSGPVEAKSNTFVDAQGQHWVRVTLCRGDLQAEVWSRVGRMAPATFLPSLLWMVLQAGLFVVGMIVYWKRPHDGAARLFYVQSLVVIGAYLGGYHWARICTQPLLTSVYIICAVLLPAVNLHFFLRVPTPRPVLQRHPVATLAAVYTVPVAFLALILVCYALVRWLGRSGGSHEQVTNALEALRGAVFVYIGVAAAWYVASIAALVYGLWAATNRVERNQLRLLLVGAVAALGPIGFTLFLANQRPAALTGGAASWPMFAASACFTFAYGVAITRYRLLQFDQLLSVGLAYFMVSGLAAMIYCALVVSGMLLFDTQGPSLEQAAWVSGSALVLSIALDAARLRLRTYLDRRFRRDKTQLDDILQQLGAAIDQLADAPTLAVRLLEVSTELYGYSRGGLYVFDQPSASFRLTGSLGIEGAAGRIPDGSALIAALRERQSVSLGHFPPGHPTRQALVELAGEVAVALTHEKAVIGVLVLGRGPNPPARAVEPARLASFAPIAALALAGSEVRRSVELLNRELQTKVEKISEQQRRIFSLQQQLVAQTRRLPLAEPGAGASPPPTSAALAAIVGSSGPIQTVLELVPKVAANISAVLIRGESGTGKELFARAVHDLSPRAGGPFVKVHCAALAPGVLESELFGHVKGAFTGALRDKAGRFEAAHGGTVFLDEIGDISPEVQTKLLRVLQEKAFERVGSNEPVRVDVRLVTATHQDLDRLIREGRFRADLYYRLNVITLHVPPLRDRGEDVIELALHLLRLHAARCGKAVDAIEDEVLLLLRDYAWPGNIRELENVMERAVVVCEGTTVTVADLPAEVARPRPKRPAPDPTAYVAYRTPDGRGRAARHARERAEILEALDRAAWNKTEAARELGLARSTLLNRMKKLGVDDSRAG